MPEGPPYHELIDGEFLVSEAPTYYHQDIALRLTLLLAPWANRTRAGRTFFAPVDVILSEFDAVQPDLLFVARDCLHILKNGRIYGAPDLMVEILSPSTASFDRRRKRALYAHSGVREFWIVDPKSRRIEILRLSGAGYNAPEIFGAGSIVTTPFLPDLNIDVSAIFTDPWEP